MVISPEEAIVMGCLAGTGIKDLLLRRERAFFEVNLYRGSVQAPNMDDMRFIHEMSAQTPAADSPERVHPVFTDMKVGIHTQNANVVKLAQLHTTEV
jgi:hypothetical protein